MTLRQYVRRQSRRALVWRVFYGGGELVGQGSIVDVHENGCRISGRMPVELGTRLRLCIWPADKPTDILVMQGTVRWTKGLEFGLLLDTQMPNFEELARQKEQQAGAGHSGDLANSSYNSVSGGPENHG